MIKYVTVIGSSGKIDEKTYSIAEKLGEILAQNKYIIVTGGRSGVMEAVCKGAKKAGGLTIGILPGFTREDANPYVDIIIPTGLGYARNAINVLAGDVVVAISGGPGTLSEIGLALAYNKPLIVLKGCGGVSELISKEGIKEYNIEIANTPEEVLEKIRKMKNKVTC